VAPLLASKGVDVMLAGNMGMGALNVLNAYGVQVLRGCYGEVGQVVKDYLSGQVNDSGEACHSHENCNKG
jgi:predicted Fe-Mo cluster-binding NifX family protein